MPSACAPTIGRVVSNVLIAACTRELLPSRARASRASSFSSPPSRHELGTRTSSNSTSPVCEARMPIFFSFFPPVRPGVLGGTTKEAWPRDPSSGSTLATTTCTLGRSSNPPLVMNVFLALVRRLDTSEPAPGSVTQKEERWMSSGVPKHCGTHSAICSGVPLPAMPAAPRVLPKIASEIPASPQHIFTLVPLVTGGPHDLLGEVVHPLLDLLLILVEIERELGHRALLAAGVADP